MIALWIGFIAFVLLMLALDLGVLHRRSQVIGTREALRWTGIVAVIALLFSGGVYFLYEFQWFGAGAAYGQTGRGKKAALDFLTGYLVEQSLSLDNIFVIAMIFAYFGIPIIYQHRLLFWGILGALIMRGAMILAGTALINRFHAIIYLFGGLLIVTAVKMLFSRDQKVVPERNPLVRLARSLYPVTGTIEDDRFFTRMNGRRAITPLFLALLIVESTDVLFAIDSIPAIFAVTTDPFIVFTSNVFAILCLRSMYFALAGMLSYFHHLKTSLVFILAFVGVKMLMSEWYPISSAISLLVISAALAGGIVPSVWGGRGRMALARPRPEPIPEVVTTSVMPGAGASDHPRCVQG